MPKTKAAPRFTPPVEKAIVDLLLDNLNPRIPLNKHKLSQDDLTLFVAEEYNSLAIARSIAAHEYFSSEPLIAIPGKGKEKSKLIVVEGNRRLAALKLLLNEELRNKLSNQTEWDTLPKEHVPVTVPVVVVNDRREVAPVIGYRHISGIQPWDAYSKARYIASQIEGGLSFEETAIEVGEKVPAVRDNYRNYLIAEQVEELRVDPEELSAMINGFGIFTRAMQSPKLREFIGAQASDAVQKGKKAVPAEKKDALKEFVSLLFGPSAVLEDSRDLTKLGKVVASEDGLKVLRKTRNLEEAHIASGGLRDRLVTRLSNGGTNLRAANTDIADYKKDEEVLGLLGACKEALGDLEKSVR